MVSPIWMILFFTSAVGATSAAGGCASFIAAFATTFYTLMPGEGVGWG